MTLTIQEVKDRLSTLLDWEMNDEGQIQKNFSFESFQDGLHFLNQAAQEAERRGYTPCLSILGETVRIQLNTQGEEGFTENHFGLAHALERLYPDSSDF
ncbi:4a-hydroxytetrahydrobiopterin dehydratase [Jeotgalibacillus campisalis]|uniref:4a-hydroxytetrahydrobiopterin dehydratase n=1 Tax=Jeotgalibacillus campisalis TaxID=220754 RepID=A0A0C2VGA8_9BACL|nr:4a-hydroxytetrahydrobiopterin dehydratase [Jeotgalibacillus campisalis]KIL47927.1 4a-hydroxytetrahydrobiopterin dehydratase [Jeotgalibacillus campisalis]